MNDTSPAIVSSALPDDRLQQQLIAQEAELAALRRDNALLRAEQAQADRAFHSAPIGIAAVGLDGRFLRVNQALCDMVGRTPEELLSLRFGQITHPDDRDIDVAHMRRMAAGEETTLQREKRYIHADGHVIWLLLNVTIVVDDDRKPLYFWSHLQDITHRKAIEQELAESRRLNLAFMEALPVGVYILDGASRPFYANQTARRLLGGGIAPNTGEHAAVYRCCIAGTDVAYPQDRLPFVRALTGTASTVDDIEVYLPEGVTPLEMSATPIFDSSGNISHAVAVINDISERRRSERALQQSIAQEEIIRVQEAHLRELSTPLIPISDDILAMPLIGSIDSQRAQQLIGVLLQGVSELHARVVILDITGVVVVDTQVANSLLHAAQAVQLLGAQVILTGIRPEVAQTLVGLGVDLRGIVTRATLQGGIAYAMERR